MTLCLSVTQGREGKNATHPRTFPCFLSGLYGMVAP
jgi:hypothetical protein